MIKSRFLANLYDDKVGKIIYNYIDNDTLLILRRCSKNTYNILSRFSIYIPNHMEIIDLEGIYEDRIDKLSYRVCYHYHNKELEKDKALLVNETLCLFKGFCYEYTEYDKLSDNCIRNNLHFSENDFIKNFYIDIYSDKYCIFKNNSLILSVNFDQDIVLNQVFSKFINVESKNLLIHALRDGSLIIYDVLSQVKFKKTIPFYDPQYDEFGQFDFVNGILWIVLKSKPYKWEEESDYFNPRNYNYKFIYIFIEDLMERELKKTKDEQKFVFEYINFSNGIDLWKNGGFTFQLDYQGYGVYSTIYNVYSDEVDDYILVMISFHIQEKVTKLKYFGTKTDLKLNRNAYKLILNSFHQEEYKIKDLFRWYTHFDQELVTFNNVIFVLRSDRFIVLLNNVTDDTKLIPITMLTYPEEEYIRLFWVENGDNRILQIFLRTSMKKINEIDNFEYDWYLKRFDD